MVERIAFAERRDHHYDQLAFVLRALADLHRCPYGRTDEIPTSQPVLRRHAARSGQRIVVLHAHDLIVDLGIEDGWHEPGTDALYRVAGRAARRKVPRWHPALPQ